MRRNRLMFVPVAALLVALALPGCGGSGGGGGGDFSQDFEPPATPPATVQDPPDTGDELSPRERRNQD